MDTQGGELVVQLERCILQATTLADYRILLENSEKRNGEHSNLLQIIREQCEELRLGQQIFASDNLPASFIVVDLVPATAGRLCDATTIIVFQPTDRSQVDAVCDALHQAEGECNSYNNDEMCVVVVDYSLTGSIALGSRDFFLRTLAVDGSIVSIGDEEYSTFFVVNMMESEITDDATNIFLLRTSPDVFRNIRASLFFDTMSTVIAAGVQQSTQQLRVPFFLFRILRDEISFLPITMEAETSSSKLQLSSLCFVPAWPRFVLIAFFGEMYEELLTIALHTSKVDLNGRIVAEGDVVVLCITPDLFVERQSLCMNAAEAVLARVAHYVQSGYAFTSLGLLLRGGVIAIPLRVAEIISSPPGRSYGVLNLVDDGTEVLMSLSGAAVVSADFTPLFPPPRLMPAFYSQLSFTMSICNALESFFSFSYQSGRTCVFVLHALPENMPYECLVTVLLKQCLECLIVDLDRWNDEELEGLISNYMRSAGEVALVFKNAQCLIDRLWVLQMFETTDSVFANLPVVRSIFLVFESLEEPPPTISARACNVQGVLKGVNPSEEDRRIILEKQFEEAERVFGVRKSMLLTFDLLASWTVGLSVADVVAYIQECICVLTSVRLAEGVHPVLSESLCEVVLQKYQKAHGRSLVSTRLQPVHWDDIGGLEEAKRELQEMIQLPLLHPELFASGAKRRTGVLFYGPPGCGKTLLAKAVATEMNMNFMAVKGPELINQYVGESERNIRLLFQRARDNSPCIIFFDELDALAPARGAKGDAGGAMDRVVAQLLVEVDGVGHRRTDGTACGEVFIIGATNRPDLLDPSLLRPGRFDRLCYLGIPSTRKEQLGALAALTRKFHLADDVDFEALIGPLSFEYTGADFFALSSDAMMFAVESFMQENTAEGGDDEKGHPSRLVVRMCDFVRARNQLQPSVTSEDLQRYEALRGKFAV